MAQNGAIMELYKKTAEVKVSCVRVAQWLPVMPARAACPCMTLGRALPSKPPLVHASLQAKAVQEYVQLLLDNGQKFLVFAHHTSLLDAIEHTCNRSKGCE